MTSLVEYDFDEEDAYYDEQSANVLRVNERYLDDAIGHKNATLHKAKFIFVKSPKGTGKTNWLAKYLRSLPSTWHVLQLGHRRSLERKLAHDLGLVCYLDSKKPTDRYAVSMDSLDFIHDQRSYDVLVIDEVEQVLRHFLSDTTKSKRNLIFKILIRLIREAKQVICLDADMTDELTIDLIFKLSGGSYVDSVAVINEWKTDRSMDLYENKNHLIYELLGAINNGRRVFVPVGKKELAEKLVTLLQFVNDKEGKPVKVLCLTGDSNEERNHKEFFFDPNGESKKYQVLIATSTLSTGVSIDVKWFDAVYGVFDARIYTYQDADQAISRVRSSKDVKVWIHDDTRRTLQSEHAIRTGAAALELATRTLSLGEADLSEGEQLYLYFVTRLKWCEQKWRHNRKRQFMELKSEEGWTVNWKPVSEYEKQAGAELLKLALNPDGKKKYRLIHEAPSLSADQAHELRLISSTKLTKTEKRSLTKSVVADFYGVSPSDLTLQQIVDYDSKKFRNVMQNVKLLEQKRDAALQFDRRERESENAKRAFPEFRHNTKRRDLLAAIIDAVDINVGKVFEAAAKYKGVQLEYERVKNDESASERQKRAASKHRNEQLANLQWEITAAQIDRGVEYATNNLNDINGFLEKNFKKPNAPEAKLKVFNGMLKEVGIMVKKKRLMKEGDRSVIYCIDYDQVAELASMVNLSLYPKLMGG